MCSAWLTMPVRIEPGVDLDEADDVGMLGADELGDAAEHLAVAAQVARARERQVKRRARAGGIADVVDRAVANPLNPQAGKCGILTEFCCETRAMSQANPIRLFVTHIWENSDDYLRVFEYLESARNFFYRNYSTPEHRPVGDKEALKEDLRKQIARRGRDRALEPAMSSIRDLVTFQLLYAQANHKPVMLHEAVRRASADAQGHHRACQRDRRLGRAGAGRRMRRQARHEDTTRWDTIEFKLE